MTDVASLLVVREDPSDYDADAMRLSHALLTRTALFVAGEEFRLLEVELYYYGERHRDPFAHRDPLQSEPGHWYFHRSGGSYRGGTYKGLDLTFGRRGTYGGVLLRSLRRPDGTVVSGPSLCVDELLSRTGAPTVAALHARASNAFERSNPLHLRSSPPVRTEILRTARVGLTLKRGDLSREMPAYIMRPDRFLTDLRAIKKGRVQTVVALHQRGLDVPSIQACTGSPRHAIERWVEAFEEGRRWGRFEPYMGRAVEGGELAFLIGVWVRDHGLGSGGAAPGDRALL